MKKILSAVILLAAASFVFAAGKGSDLYYYNVRVEKIYTCRDGYRIIYRSTGAKYHEMYVPAKWFTAGGKIEHHITDASTSNYLSVFYKNGEFSHAKLYASPLFSDSLWERMPYGDFSSRFDVEDIQLEF